MAKDVFVIVTKDYSGLGWAKMVKDAGATAFIAYHSKDIPKDEEDRYAKVGEGIAEKAPLSRFIENRAKLKNAYWIWDANHDSGVADQLRKEGFKVFGGHRLADKMEHDRIFAADLVKRAGIEVPETFEFKSIKDGVKFLEEHEDEAYVFKPDENKDGTPWCTTVPDNERDEKANEEIRLFLASMKEGEGDYILQKRVQGVEINIEGWFYKGKPFFAHANFECKRKYNRDLGPLIGCSQDIEFTIPIDCKVMKAVVLKIAALPEFKDYTGYIDSNVIVADNKYYFLEFCARFGYNSHPNLFLNLAIDPVTEILKAHVDGNIQDFYSHFRPGFGASVLMSIDTEVQGLPLIIPDDKDKKFYHYDAMMDGDQYRLAGFGHEVGIACGHAYDLKSAAEEAIDTFDAIHYPGRAGRTDIAETNYDTNPYERWVAAGAMKLFERT